MSKADEVDVRGIRQGLKLTQEEFAERFDFTLSTLRQWEQHRRQPPRAVRVLLRVIARSPEVVAEAVRAA